MMPVRAECLGVPLLRLLHLQAGKPRLVKGYRKAIFGPHLYPDTNLSKEIEASWRKHGVAGRHSLPSNRRDTLALGWVGFLGAGLGRRPPAASITAGPKR